MDNQKFLDKTGLSRIIAKIKEYIDNTKTSNSFISKTEPANATESDVWFVIESEE